jgi:hypothetical protein
MTTTQKLKAWATAPARPWLIKYMLGFFVVGCVWLFVENYWPNSIAFKIASGGLALYVLSLKPVLGFGPTAKKRREPQQSTSG